MMFVWPLTKSKRERKREGERLNTNDRSNRICRHCRYFGNLYTAAAAPIPFPIRLSLKFSFSFSINRNPFKFLFDWFNWSVSGVCVCVFFAIQPAFFSQVRLFTQILFASTLEIGHIFRSNKSIDIKKENGWLNK